MKLESKCEYNLDLLVKVCFSKRKSLETALIYILISESFLKWWKIGIMIQKFNAFGNNWLIHWLQRIISQNDSKAPLFYHFKLFSNFQPFDVWFISEKSINHQSHQITSLMKMFFNQKNERKKFLYWPRYSE